MVRDTPGALLFRGGGTKQGWGAPAELVDAVVETCGLDQLVEHSAGDMVAIVGAGLRLTALQAALAPSGQWLAVDPPLAQGSGESPNGDGATVGGVIATNDHGPRRLRYGSPRDLLIGVTVVLADGSVVQAGGRVVKNVAGFDLMRLLCGSFGTLGLMTHAIVRLHPLPEASLTLVFEGDVATLGRLVLALLASPVEPAAMDVAGGALWLRLEGRAAGIAAQAEAARKLAGTHGVRPGGRLDGQDEATAWDGLTAAHAGEPGETVARAATLPDRLHAVAAALREVAPEATLASHAGLGLHTARFRSPGHADAVRAWRQRVAALGGTVVLRRHADDLGNSADVWGPEPSAISVMRRVKARLDPDRRCAPGRFVGGL